MKNKPSFLIALFFIGVAIFSAYPALVQAQTPLEGAGSGLVGWWKFDEGSGLNALDSSGNNTTGIIMGNPERTTGVSGGALKFNGITDYVRIPNNSALNAGVMTISMWANMQNNQLNSSSFFGWGRNGCTDNYRAWWIPNGQIHASYQTTSGALNRNAVVSEIGAIKLGKWEHYTFVYSGNSSSVTITLYKNGVSTGVVYSNTDGLASCGQLTAIGDQEDLPNPGYLRTFSGVMDDFRVYNRALSASEVTALYNEYRPAITDTTAPTAPTGLTATAVSARQVNLAWNASTDNVGVAGYVIYRGGSPMAVVTSGTTYTDIAHTISCFSFTLSPSTSYAYSVVAFDAAGNNSSQSASASVTTPAASSAMYTLSVTMAGSSLNTVSSTPSGISCSSGTCTASFPAGETILLFPPHSLWASAFLRRRSRAGRGAAVQGSGNASSP